MFNERRWLRYRSAEVVIAIAILGVYALLTLAGCTSTTNPRLAVEDDAACRAYGFTPGTETFAACRLNLDQTRVAEARERLHAIGAAARAYSAARAAQQANDPTVCTAQSMRTGIITNTTITCM